MERLVIRVDANTQIGMGHLMRCLALAQAWQDASGQVTVVTACQNEELQQRLCEEGLDLRLLIHPYPDTADWDYTRDILTAYPDAWLVLDGYHFDEVYQQRVKDADHRLLVIDDMAQLEHYYADILLNQNLHAAELHYSCEPYTRLLLGTHYVLLQRKFLVWRDWQRDVPELARRVLVTMGGSDPENHTLKVIEALQQVDVPGLEATVVIGASSQHADVVEAAARHSHVPIRLIRDARDMPGLMAGADIAIAMAGSTVWELMFMGLPAILTAASDNQQPVARSAADADAAIWVDCELAEKMAKAIESLSRDNALRLEMARKGKQLVDGKGTEGIISEMLQKVRL